MSDKMFCRGIWATIELFYTTHAEIGLTGESMIVRSVYWTHPLSSSILNKHGLLCTKRFVKVFCLICIIPSVILKMLTAADFIPLEARLSWVYHKTENCRSVASKELLTGLENLSWSCLLTEGKLGRILAFKRSSVTFPLSCYFSN